VALTNDSGASFLTNVYSAFRYNPTAVGFAALTGNESSVSNGTVSTSNVVVSIGWTKSNETARPVLDVE
jgi:hypothetical protein